MMFRAMSSTTSAGSKRTQLMDIVMRGYLMDKALKQGLSEAEARAAVAQHVAQAKLSKQHSFRESMHEASAGPTTTEPIASGVAGDVLAESTTVAPPSNDDTRLFLSRTIEPPPVEVAVKVPPTDTIFSYDTEMASHLNSISSMTTKDLRKLVRGNSAQHDMLLTDKSAAHSELLRQQAKQKASKEVQDMVNYVLFLVLFLVVTLYGRADDTPFKMTFNLMTQLKEKPFPARVSHVPKIFDDVANVNEMHHFLTGVFYDNIYAGSSFDGDVAFPEGPTYNAKGMLGTYGQIWGPIRIGQVRVDGVPCAGTLATMLNMTSSTCFPSLSSTSMSRTPFGLHGETYAPDEPPDAAVLFLSPSERWYPAPNFNVYLSPVEPSGCNPKTRVNCPQYERLDGLRHHKFFDMATRALFVDMTLYNANFNQVSTVRLFFEHTPAGGLDPYAEFTTYRLYNYETPSDYVRLVCQLLILAIVTYELSKEMRAAWTTGRIYFQSAANWIFCLNYGLFYVVAVLRLLSYATLPTTESLHSTTFVNFRTSVMYFAYAEYVNSVICLLSWMKLFHFLTFIHVFNQLILTITKAAKELYGLLVIFVLVLLGSSMAFHMTFGLRLKGFQTLTKSFLTLLRIVVNKLEFQELVETNRVLGPLFFASFGILMIFVILNMFIVIITDAYIEAQTELDTMAQVELNTMSKEIVHHVLYNIVFRIPFVGTRYLQPTYELALQRTKAMVDTKTQRHSHSAIASANLVVVSNSKDAVRPKSVVAPLLVPPAIVETSTLPEASPPTLVEPAIPTLLEPVTPIHSTTPTSVPVVDHGRITLPPVRVLKTLSATGLCSVRESSCEVEHAYASSVHWARQRLVALGPHASVEDLVRFRAHLEQYKRQCLAAIAP